jgi:hypothetical protein
MAITYALPDIPVRGSTRPRPSGLLCARADHERPRRLTPYPDPLRKFPLSDEEEDPNSGVKDEEGLNKPIEINFTPLPAALRRTPSAPAKKAQDDDGGRRERRSSLPFSKGFCVDGGRPGAGKRRRGWIVPKEVIRDCLADLKRYVTVIGRGVKLLQLSNYDSF